MWWCIDDKRLVEVDAIFFLFVCWHTRKIVVCRFCVCRCGFFGYIPFSCFSLGMIV